MLFLFFHFLIFKLPVDDFLSPLDNSIVADLNKVIVVGLTKNLIYITGVVFLIFFRIFSKQSFQRRPQEVSELRFCKDRRLKSSKFPDFLLLR